jgi:hypothetical protein
MTDSIDLVGRQMCEECEAFLGKPHQEGCSKHGRLVEMADATEKFTTVERANAEEPLIGLNADTVELLLRSMIPPEVAGDDAEELKALRQGFETFVTEARESERSVQEEPS